MSKDTRACAVLRVLVQRARSDVGRSGRRRLLDHDRRSSEKADGSRGHDNSAREDKSHPALTTARSGDGQSYVNPFGKVDYLPKT
ncbi:hypothetical protein GW17_00021285 [Ensete ventricosum]|nr:hypothetical protein GW17_00021285 [Ensete ventricosum]